MDTSVQTENEMVERIAAIICAYKEPFSEGCARDILRAIREPTEAMIVNGLRAEKGLTSPQTLKRDWQAMIDAALSSSAPA